MWHSGNNYLTVLHISVCLTWSNLYRVKREEISFVGEMTRSLVSMVTAGISNNAQCRMNSKEEGTC
jgi:hypothetical protein